MTALLALLLLPAAYYAGYPVAWVTYRYLAPLGVKLSAKRYEWSEGHRY